MIKHARFACLSGGTALIAALAFAGTASASTGPALPPGTQTAVTHITNRPDSGDQGNNWALDNFTRTVTVVRHSQVAPSDCGVTAPTSCWNYTYTIKDSGDSVTIAGQDSPRTTQLLDQSLSVEMRGGTTTGQFYTTSGSPHASLVETSENDHGTDPTGDHTTGNWIEQFFLPTAVFGANNLGANAGWTYTGNFGFDPACPNDAYQWVDAAPDWGVGGVHGNILTPNSSDCS